MGLVDALESAHFSVKNVTVSLGIGLVTLVLVLYYIYMRKAVPAFQRIVMGTPKPRFRKREKILFYGRKMLRRVSSFAKNNIAASSGGRRGRESRKKKLVLSIARKLLRFKKEQEPQWKAREPPPSLLEVDWHELEYEYRLPAELMYMLRNVRVLGHFEKPIFLELCRFMESRFIPAGTYLFKIGDPDDSIYVIQSGTVNVYITEPDGKEFGVKQVNKGESIHSLLSILDVLTGHPAPYKTVSAAAFTDSTILRLPAHAFQIVLERFPESMVRVIQIIMVRLQRVTFMALHNYLGLSHELINPENPADKNFLIHTIASHLKTSPVHSAVPVEGRVAPAGAENEAITKTAIPLTPVEDDATGNVVTEQVETKRKTLNRKTSESTGKTRIDVEQPASDFAVACSRARVAGSLLDDDPLVSLSPPVHVSDDYSSLVGTPTRKIRKAVLTDTRSIIPNPPLTTLPAKEQLDDSQILDMATQDIASLLGLKDVKQLQGKCQLLYFRTGTTLIKQGDQESNLYFVVTGLLEVQQQMVGKESEQRTMYRVCPGELVGTLAVLTGEPSFFTIRVMTDARLIFIAKNEFYQIMKEQPKVVLNVGHTVVQRMSGFVRQIDFALDWMLIEAGRALYRQGEQSDCVYIILNGRLRSVVQLPSGKKELVGEYGRGELVGLVEVLTQTDRSTTMMAVRDTELAQIPDELLNLIKRKYPQIVTRLIHLLGQRILGSLGNRANAYAVLSEHPNVEPRPTVANLATVAVLPVSDKVPLSNFTLELQHALTGIGPTLRLNSEIVQNKLGNAAFDSINEYRLSSWLGQQEDIHRMVLYQCDIRMTPWTQRCIRQADCVLILALANQDPAVGQLEKQLDNMAVRAQKELILLHRQDGPNLKNTVEWLNLREWCSSHHHIRCHKRVFSRKPQAKIMETYQKLLDSEPDRMSDFSRLARFLTGTAVGLVLGGGGARGCAHVGMIRALTEARIPIDFIGGTSIGSFMGALWAEETNFTRFMQRAREWCRDMNCLWKKLFDLTYPSTAMFSGAAFNRTIESVFHDRQIEDLWIPYFCITTDLTASKMRVHTHGSLWRYVRASMSLSGYLPPLCDPLDGHLLLDGGYVNNLPADVMKVMGAQSIFAIDVGSQDETDLTNYGDELSGWWLLWKRWYPWAKPVKVPNMAEIQSRLAYVSCVRQLEQVKDSGCCEYVRPAIDKYHTLQFGSFDDIYEVGYAHGKTLLGEWEKAGRIKDLFTEIHAECRPTVNKSIIPAEANFTDLAELISRIDDPKDVNAAVCASGSNGTNFYISEGGTDEDDKISVTSEPIVSLNSPKVCHRNRAGSEGASPGSASASSAEEDEDDDDEYRASDSNLPPLTSNLVMEETESDSCSSSPPKVATNKVTTAASPPSDDLQHRSLFQITGQEVQS